MLLQWHDLAILPTMRKRKILTSLYFIADYSGDNTHILIIPYSCRWMSKCKSNSCVLPVSSMTAGTTWIACIVQITGTNTTEISISYFSEDIKNTEQVNCCCEYFSVLNCMQILLLCFIPCQIKLKWRLSL